MEHLTSLLHTAMHHYLLTFALASWFKESNHMAKNEISAQMNLNFVSSFDSLISILFKMCSVCEL